MPELLWLTLAALGLGYLSAVFPLVNAEATALAGGAAATVPAAVLVSGALALGQTAGKLSIFWAVRKGRRTIEQRRPKERKPARWGWLQRLREWGERLVGQLDRRPTAALVVLLAASVGIPPLLAVAFAAGSSKMRWADFAVCCLLGRWARFAVLAVPVALAAH